VSFQTGCANEDRSSTKIPRDEVAMKKDVLHILYHIVVVVLSAAFAFSLPQTIGYISRTILAYWSYIENRELVLLSTEIAAAIILIITVNSLVRGWRARMRLSMAKLAGLSGVAPATSYLARRRMKKLKQEQGSGRSVLLIASTGSQTFADPAGDLHHVLRNCREAKIMLLDPLKEGVTARAKSLADPAITPESFREQIIRSIDFLKGLKGLQKNVRLKLYGDVPILKLSVLGDYLFLQHYPTGLNVRKMPEYVFKHDLDGSLFSLFYHYFVTRWFDTNIPEYDLTTDELVYRDKTGNEMRREKFNEIVMEY
jgi:hypothetical protein